MSASLGERDAAMFNELCVKFGFCSLGSEGEAQVLSSLAASADDAARAVFAAEGLDYDTDGRGGLKADVRDCIIRHMGA